MPDLTRRSIGEGIDFLPIANHQFKTGLLTVSLHLPLQKEAAAQNAILPQLLTRTCRAYPDMTALNEKLAQLYGARLFDNVGRLGENQVLSIGILFLDDRYALDDTSVSDQCAELLCDLLFDPALEDEKFRAADVEREKRVLTEVIQSEIVDKRTYSKNRCEQIMCEGEAYGVSRYGTVEQVAALTPAQVTKAWRDALENAYVSVSTLGDIKSDALVERMQEAFSRCNRKKPERPAPQIVPAPAKVKEVAEQLPVQQAKLVLGFRTSIAEPSDEVMAARVMTALFGGTPTSKLFLNVREKLSLCYYCAARYDRQKGVLLVESGIERPNKEKAQAEILRQLEDLKQGKFTDEELAATILSVQNSFRTVSDSQFGLGNWYESQLFDRTFQSPEEAAESAGHVTRDQVIAAAKTVTLDTVYLLEGEEAKA